MASWPGGTLRSLTASCSLFARFSCVALDTTLAMRTSWSWWTLQGRSIKCTCLMCLYVQLCIILPRSNHNTKERIYNKFIYKLKHGLWKRKAISLLEDKLTVSPCAPLLPGAPSGPAGPYGDEKQCCVHV